PAKSRPHSTKATPTPPIVPPDPMSLPNPPRNTDMPSQKNTLDGRVPPPENPQSKPAKKEGADTALFLRETGFEFEKSSPQQTAVFQSSTSRAPSPPYESITAPSVRHTAAFDSPLQPGTSTVNHTAEFALPLSLPKQDTPSQVETPKESQAPGVRLFSPASTASNTTNTAEFAAVPSTASTSLKSKSVQDSVLLPKQHTSSQSQTSSPPSQTVAFTRDNLRSTNIHRRSESPVQVESLIQASKSSTKPSKTVETKKSSQNETSQSDDVEDAINAIFANFDEPKKE
ncbi:MAG: hypothetical protein AAGJ35_16055, partial [Myxococcota bacterium]